ncbi:DUF2530 domain-containing protein [Catelliglobosispora koreensis]|uniref:DUF2530 domain-containing protein n=1 Tax=Catelliglobosispora koreensis TaxID=129052 RepID=UPI0003A836CB
MSKQQTVDPPMVPFAIAGIAAFAIAALAVWIADGPTSWLQVCLAGVIWGIPGLLTMIVHDRNRSRQHSDAG